MPTGVPDTLIAYMDSIGARWWTTRTAFAAGGTAVARVAIDAAYRVPDASRMMLGWRPLQVAADMAVAEPLLSVFDIVGTDFKYQPQEVPGPVASSLLLEGAHNTSLSEWWPVFAPVAGSERYDVGIEPLSAIAGNSRAAVEFTWCDRLLPFNVIYSQSSREISVDGAGTSVGTTLNISNASQLIEVGGVVVQEAQTVEEEVFAALVSTSTVWDPVQQIDCILEPVSAIIDATIDQDEPGAYMARRSERVTFRSRTAAIVNNFILDVDVTNAATGEHYIRWR
mgnify:CR=1 FL=1